MQKKYGGIKMQVRGLLCWFRNAAYQRIWEKISEKVFFFGLWLYVNAFPANFWKSVPLNWCYFTHVFKTMLFAARNSLRVLCFTLDDKKAPGGISSKKLFKMLLGELSKYTLQRNK